MLHNRPPTQHPGRGSTKSLAHPSISSLALVCACFAILLGASTVGSTLSSFFNNEGMAANAFHAGTWESAPSPDVSDAAAPQALVVTLSDVQLVPPPDDSPPPAEDPPADTSAADAPPVVEVSDPVLVSVSDPPADTLPTDTPPSQ